MSGGFNVHLCPHTAGWLPTVHLLPLLTLFLGFGPRICEVITLEAGTISTKVTDALESRTLDR